MITTTTNEKKKPRSAEPPLALSAIDLRDADALRRLPDCEFEPLYAAARSAQESLEQSAVEEAASAAEAQGAWQASPTLETLPARDICAQRAANARGAAAAHLEEISAVERENTRRKEARELLDLRNQENTGPKVHAIAAAIVALTATYESELRKHLSELQALNAQRNSITRKLTLLESMHGNGASYRDHDLSPMVHVLSEKLLNHFGEQAQTLGVGNVQLSHWRPGGSGDHAVIKLELLTHLHGKGV